MIRYEKHYEIYIQRIVFRKQAFHELMWLSILSLYFRVKWMGEEIRAQAKDIYKKNILSFIGITSIYVIPTAAWSSYIHWRFGSDSVTMVLLYLIWCVMISPMKFGLRDIALKSIKGERFSIKLLFLPYLNYEIAIKYTAIEFASSGSRYIFYFLALGLSSNAHIYRSPFLYSLSLICGWGQYYLPFLFALSFFPIGTDFVLHPNKPLKELFVDAWIKMHGRRVEWLLFMVPLAAYYVVQFLFPVLLVGLIQNFLYANIAWFVASTAWSLLLLPYIILCETLFAKKMLRGE